MLLNAWKMQQVLLTLTLGKVHFLPLSVDDVLAGTIPVLQLGYYTNCRTQVYLLMSLVQKSVSHQRIQFVTVIANYYSTGRPCWGRPCLMTHYTSAKDLRQKLSTAPKCA